MFFHLIFLESEFKILFNHKEHNKRHNIFLGETLSGENPSMNSSFNYSDELQKSRYNNSLWDDNITRDRKRIIDPRSNPSPARSTAQLR